MNNIFDIKYLKENALKYNIEDKFLKLSCISDKLEESKKEDIVFYKVYNNETSKDKLRSRLNKCNIGLIITTGHVDELEQYNYIVVADEQFLLIQQYFCDILYPYPQNDFKLIGVTGTNGKTSVVNLATQILEENNIPSYSIGTIGVMNSKGERLYETALTTPSYIDLRKIFNKFSKVYKVCFMELSSHALAQDRLYDLRLDVAAWTSFSRDHLDYHKSMDEYFTAKSLIGTKYLKRSGVVIVPNDKNEIIKKLEQLNLNIKTTSKISIDLPLEFSVDYNKENLEVALELCKFVGVSKNSSPNFEKLKLPLGRFSIIKYGEALVVIDYSHTPEALENISKAIKKTFINYSLSVIFGCGGDRDPGKRPLMAKAILNYADKVIITTDNPRFEKPEEIVKDIVKGIPEDYIYKIILSRAEAIKSSLAEIKKNEVLLIAGKGHEEYQDIKGVKYEFSDFDTVNDFIKLQGQ